VKTVSRPFATYETAYFFCDIGNHRLRHGKPDIFAALTAQICTVFWLKAYLEIMIS
jgi:hypothetical protein